MSKIFRRSMRLGLIAAGVVAGLMAGGMLHSGTARAGGPTSRPGPTAEQATEEIHSVFEDFSHEFGITDAEKPKMTEIENKAAAAVKADPKKLMDKDFQKSIIVDIRAILTPEQQKKIDHMLDAARMAKTASNLHQLGLACLLWENENHQKTPPDLGSLLDEQLSPEVFLMPESKTTVPDNWSSMDKAAKAEWVNKNSDFVYLGGGKNSDEEGATFVVAYLKPELSAEGNNIFLMGDMSAQTKSADDTKAILADLKAGKNPPPSYKETPTPMPTGPRPQ